MSPSVTDALCMLCLLSGIRYETVGNCEKSLGNCASVLNVLVGTLLKFNHGACRCTYSPLEHAAGLPG